MIQTEETVIRQLILHRYVQGENTSIINDSLPDYDEGEEETLKKIFLKPFLSHTETFEFSHEINLEYNVLYKISQSILAGEDFTEASRQIMQHLDACSKHPNIKDGDLFIVQFEDLRFHNKYHQALGIYKFEDKESYIETSASGRRVQFNFRKGIGSKKPDKACLIIFGEEPYTLLIIDSHTRETTYWQDDFIKQKSKKDHINSTNNFLTIAKNFITQQIPEEYEVSKADQIDFLNRSVDYFKTHDSFDKKEFEQEVFGEKELIRSFHQFDVSYRRENEIEMSDQFEISNEAVKKQARVFKSVLKLDKNFHIYIHGDRDLIERGVDERGRKFYKIYYEEES